MYVARVRLRFVLTIKSLQTFERRKKKVFAHCTYYRHNSIVLLAKPRSQITFFVSACACNWQISHFSMKKKKMFAGQESRSTQNECRFQFFFLMQSNQFVDLLAYEITYRTVWNLFSCFSFIFLFLLLWCFTHLAFGPFKQTLLFSFVTIAIRIVYRYWFIGIYQSRRKSI